MSFDLQLLRATNRGRWILLAAVVLGATPAVGRAQQLLPNIRDIRLGFQQVFRPGFWTPLSVEFENPGADFTGAIRLIAPDPDGLGTILTREVFLEANSSTRIDHFYRPGTYDGSLTVELLDREQRTVARSTLGQHVATQQIVTLQPAERLIVAIGPVAGIYEAATASGIVQDAQEVVRIADPTDLPPQWFAYDGVDTVVLSTTDSRILDQIDPQRASALASWVRQGGNLVVSVGSNGQTVRESFLGPLLPAQPTGETYTVKDMEPLETYVGGNLRLEVADPGMPIAAVDQNHGRVLLDHPRAKTPLLLRGHYGLGTVTLITFDVATNPFLQWDGRLPFWSTLLRFERAAAQSQEDGALVGAVMSGGGSDLAASIYSQMEVFQDVKVVHFGWVAGLILIYILLIGPVDYFLLKKVFRRLELTWITFPFWVVAISLAAYYAAFWLKGEELRINRIDVVDVDIASGTLRGTTLSSIFSPQIARYSLAVHPGNEDGAWAALGMGRDQTDRVSSWFNPPGDVFRGTYGGGGQNLLGQRHYDYWGPDAVGLLRVPISVWSSKAFESRWLGAARPVVESDLVVVDDALTGTITNQLTVPLEQVVVVYAERVYTIDSLQPGVEVDLAAVASQTLRGFLAVRGLPRSDNDYWNEPIQTADDLQRAILSISLNRSEADSVKLAVSHYFADLDLSDQLALDRVVVLAHTTAPWADLRLWINQTPEPNQPPPPITAQTRQSTFVRLILDPKRETP